MLKNNKKAMLANIISSFIVVLVGFSLMGPIAQEINNAATCQMSNSTSIFSETVTSNEDPLGTTNSFGGGGSNHFGGYDGTVKHNKFIDAVASTSMIKTNKSLLNPDCVPLTGAMATVAQLVPGFFALAILCIGIGIMYSSLSRAGMFGGSGAL
jgi:hypothetical protein